MPRQILVNQSGSDAGPIGFEGFNQPVKIRLGLGITRDALHIPAHVGLAVRVEKHRKLLGRRPLTLQPRIASASDIGAAPSLPASGLFMGIDLHTTWVLRESGHDADSLSRNPPAT
jgi:hypothetical protein